VAAVGVLALVGVAGWALASTAGTRQPGQNITGSVPGGAGPVEAGLAQARQLVDQGRALDAVKAYDTVLGLDPRQPEALAYKGFLLYRAGLADRALEQEDMAVAADPSYPDAHFFRAEILCTVRHDGAAAVGEYRAFLARAAAAGGSAQSLAPMVGSRLAKAEGGACLAPAAGAGPTTSVP